MAARIGYGRAIALTDYDIEVTARENGIHPATIEALYLTEASGAGWFPNGQLKILPEPHKFYERLPASKKTDALKQGLATRTYNETKETGHYKRMTNGPGPRYALLNKWLAYDQKAAYEAFSMGSFQIMGFNFKVCGFDSAETMFLAFCDSDAPQLYAFIKYIRSRTGGLAAMKANDWEKIEELYNGGGQNGAYAAKMRAYYNKLIKGKWKDYDVKKDMKPTAPAPVKVDGVKILSKGDVNPQVEEAQHKLVEKGYPIQADGNFGKETEDAVKQFQKANKLKVDGKIGQKTREALFKISPTTKQAAEAEIKPVVVVEEKTEQVAVVPSAATKPWWKSLSIGAMGTTILGWVTNLMTDLEPWMKFALLVLALGALGIMIYNRKKLFDETKDILKDVRAFNNNDALNTQVKDVINP